MAREEGATRPSLPPVAWLACGLWAGIAIAEAQFARTGGSVRCGTQAIAAGLAIVAGVYLRRAGIVFAFGGLLAGCLLAGWSLADWQACVERLGETGVCDLRAVVTSDARDSRWGWKATIRPEARAFGGYAVDIVGDEQCPTEQGNVVALRGKVEPVRLEDDWARRCWRAGRVARVSPWRLEVLGWQNGPMGALRRHRSEFSRQIAADGTAGSSLLRGMLLGDRRGLAGGDTEQDFRVSGMSHLLAVSGLHLGLVALGFGRVLRALRAKQPVQAAGVVAGGLAFAALTGFQPSTSRALAMVVIAWIASLSGRRGDGIAGLSVAVCAMLAYQPMSAFSISLQLSVMAVGGLLLLGGLVTHWLETLVPVGWLAKGLGATVVAQTVTLPVVAASFHVVSLIAPVANVLAIPVASAGLASGVAAVFAGFAAPSIGSALVGVSMRLFDLTAAIASATASFPHACVPLEALTPLALGVWGGSIVGAWAFWPRPAGRMHSAGVVLLALAVTSCVGIFGAGEHRLVVADVGQADAILLQDGDMTMLVDCASASGEMVEALARLGVREIDTLVLTHAHDDHTGGLGALVGAVTVGWVGIPEVADPEQRATDPAQIGRLTPRGGVALRTVRAGDYWSIGDTRVTVLWPRDATSETSTNDTSIVLLLERGGFAAVLGGDAEEGVWDALAQSGSLPDVDVLKVAHHGSSNGYSGSALAAMLPEIALVSVGAGNRFGHPSPETCAALEERGASVWRTDLEGDLSVTLDAVPTCSGAAFHEQ